MKSELFPGLADIAFAERDPAAIEAAIITAYEDRSGRTLAKGDPVRLLLESVALYIIQQRHLIDFTGKQNTLAYAEGDFLEHLGALLAVSRLAPASAVTTLKFTLSDAMPQAVVIPAGTRVTPGGGGVLFATVEDVTVPAGATEALAAAQCTEPGAAGNGFLPGQLRKIVDPFPWEMSVANVTQTSGGSDEENDENLRERIQLAPESFSVAGPRGAYEYWARSAHQDIIDVAVIGPPDLEPGYVEIYPLMKGGELPEPDIVQAVLDVCNADDIRPLTDCVSAHAPKAVSYALDVTYWIDRARATQVSELQAAVEAAASGWIAWQRGKLGRDLNPSELAHRMVAAGAKRVDIASPAFTVLRASEVAIPSSAAVTFGGLEDG